MKDFSELPDDLLLKILSLLPTIDVVATSVLSKRWRFLWKEIKRPYMVDGKLARKCYREFKKFVCRSKVESLHLKLNPLFRKTTIDSLLITEFTCYLKSVTIESTYNSLTLPKNLYVSSKLETLILKKLHIVDVPSTVRLTSLKSLHLSSVKFSNDKDVKNLLSICPCLEDLVVRQDSFTNARVFTVDVTTLKSLSIDNPFVQCWPMYVHHGFEIITPSLRQFKIRDNESNYLQFQNMPKLVKASVNVGYNQSHTFLRSLASTQYLSLCSVISQTAYLSIGLSFPSLEHLELCLCSLKWPNLLFLILKDAPRLRVLTLKSYQKHSVQSNNVMDPWNQPNHTPECLSSHLEIFEWRQYNNTEQEREVAKYILANASCLKKATFYSDHAKKYEMWKEL